MGILAKRSGHLGFLLSRADTRQSSFWRVWGLGPAAARAVLVSHSRLHNHHFECADLRFGLMLKHIVVELSVFILDVASRARWGTRSLIFSFFLVRTEVPFDSSLRQRGRAISHSTTSVFWGVHFLHKFGEPLAHSASAPQRLSYSFRCSLNLLRPESSGDPKYCRLDA